jgi:hypothetical protein
MKALQSPLRQALAARRVLLLLVALAAALPVLPARAQVPGRVNFQGLLLDSGGAPLDATVDLDFSLYETPAGGTAVWSESKPDVAVTDGIYDVELGSTTPLTPALLAAGTLYLEVAVGGEVLSPRRQLLAVPYALRSESAQSAETVGGVDASFVAALYEDTDFDGNGLVNSDPVEGVADADGDGISNFVDPDNDADGLDEPAELAQGSDPNLVTPTVTGFSPPSLTEEDPGGTITISGTNLDEPGLAVSFGGQTPTPTNVTPTSFQVVIGPLPLGSAAVEASLGNGESDQASFPVGRVVEAFVTSTQYDGNLGGIAGADQKCAERASAASLPGTYRAWLRDATTSPAQRLNYPAGTSFQRLDGVPFGTLDILTGGAVSQPLNVTELEGIVLSVGEAWTGIGGGVAAGDNCLNWSSVNFTGRVGAPLSLSGWQSSAGRVCGLTRHLYCFEE